MSQQVETDQFADIEAAINEHQSNLLSDREEILEVVEQIRASLGQLVERADDEIRHAEDLRDRTRSNIESVRVASTEEYEVAQRLGDKIETLESQLAERDKSLETLSARVEELEEAGDPEALADIQGKYEKAKEHIARIENALKEQGDAIEAGQAARARVEELEVSVKEMLAAAEQEQDSAKNLQQRLDEVSASEAFARSELERVALERDELQNAGNSHSEALQAAEHAAEQARDELAAAKEKLSEIEELHRESSEASLEKQAQIDALSADVERMRSEATNTEKRVADYEAAENTWREDCATLKSEVRELADSERAKTQSLQRAEARISELQRQVDESSEHRTRIEDLESELASERAERTTLESELSAEREGGTKTMLADQYATALRDLDAARAEIKQLRSKSNGSTPAIAEEDLASTEVETEPSTLRPAHGERIGEVLVRSGLVKEDDLEEALRMQREVRPAEHVGAILVGMGAANEDNIAQAIALQHGLDFVRLDDTIIAPSAPKLISAKMAERHRCIPLRIEAGILILAMQNPLDLIAIEDIERASEMPVRVVVVTSRELGNALDTHYSDVEV